MKATLTSLMLLAVSYWLPAQVNNEYGETPLLEGYHTNYFTTEYEPLKPDRPFEHLLLVGLGDTTALPFTITVGEFVFTHFIAGTKGLQLLPTGNLRTSLSFPNRLNLSYQTSLPGQVFREEVTVVASGLSPHRVLKYEVASNIANTDESNTIRTWQNYQVWIYEDGVIQYFFGPSHSFLQDVENWHMSYAFPFFGVEGFVHTTKGSSMSSLNLLVRDSTQVDEDGIVLPNLGWPLNGTMVQVAKDSTLFPQPEYQELTLTPNPVDEFFRLSGPPEMLWEFVIIDVTGKEVVSDHITTNENYPLYELRAGTYTLELFNEANGLRKASKLIVE